MEKFDLVVVGSGIHGLSLAKTYKDVNPGTSVLILDKGSSIGGVWAQDRLYPGLKTNNHFGTLEFSDYPMSSHGFGEDDHIPGQLVHNYLHNYAEKFRLLEHIRLNCNVVTAEEQGKDGWLVTILDEQDPAKPPSTIWASKLVVATGLTSEPFVPAFKGQDEFDAPIFHSSEFAKQSNGLGPFKKVVVMSGAKFSWDIVSAYASAGVEVDWVIRASGHGPCWMTPNRVTPLKIIPELLLQTRLVTWLSPCIWGDFDGYGLFRWFLHQTWLGRKIVDGFFFMIEHNSLSHNGYDKHPETAKLKPWDNAFFVGTNRGVLNYDNDFFDLVRSGKIRIHIADIEHLSHRTINLSNSQSLAADVLICGTGWKETPPIKFISNNELGLPGSSSTTTAMHIARADTEILSSFPRLALQPTIRSNPRQTSLSKETITKEPYRLYRFMVPPAFIHHRTLAFAGAYRSPATAIIAQTQALWITAFLGGQISGVAGSGQQFEDRIMYETVLHTQFGKWRYSRGFGDRFPELWLDGLPYVDLMLSELGLNRHRKISWWRECFEAYTPSDYEGLVEEWMNLQGQKLR